jgi:hypothetical protein
MKPRWEGAVLGFAVLMLLLPQLWTRVSGWGGTHWGWARVYQGDEPHFLILLNSLLLDGDLDLRNNYEAALDGADQGGRELAGQDVDHHVAYALDGVRKGWFELFEPMASWPRGADGRRQPQLKPGVDPKYALAPEHPAHSPGLALMTAPLLFPFRHTGLIEPLALLLSALATIWAMFLYRSTLLALSSDRVAVHLTLVAAFLGTPVWYYSRTFFSEPFLLLAIVGAYWAALVRRQLFWAGCFLGAGILLKPWVALLVPLVGLRAVRERDFKQLGLLLFASGLGLAGALCFNALLYGSPFRSYAPFFFGNPLRGAWGLLFSPARGLLWWAAPSFLLGAWGWPRLIKLHPLEGVMVLSGFLAIFGMTSLWAFWDGGWCFGPRLIVPVLPLLGMGMLSALERPLLASPRARALVGAAVLASCLLAFATVHQYWNMRQAGWFG